jgi:hypothetical protein
MFYSFGSLKAEKSIRFLTAGELYSLFSSEGFERQVQARYYVLGVLDGLLLAKDPMLCMTTNIPVEEVADLVHLHLRSRSDIHRFNAASVVREVLLTEFPCT